MKVKGQIITDDGFDRNVAEKMPKVKKEDEFPPFNLNAGIQVLKEDRQEPVQEMESPEKEIEGKVVPEPSKIAVEKERNLEVSQLIEDLHTQLLILGRTKRALEMDLASTQKTIHQLTEDNRELRSRLEDMNKGIQKLKEVQIESTYLKEENADALERVQVFHQELRVIKETLELTTRERDEAQSRIDNLQSQIGENEILRAKGRLKEREASLFAEENRELRARLEEALAQNLDLERKYMEMKKSFNEVRESLTLLRDSCKTSYYNLSETRE